MVSIYNTLARTLNHLNAGRLCTSYEKKHRNSWGDMIKTFSQRNTVNGPHKLLLLAPTGVMALVTKVMAASFTIVMPADSAGDEIWMEEAEKCVGKCGILGGGPPRDFWSSQCKYQTLTHLCSQNPYNGVRWNSHRSLSSPKHAHNDSQMAALWIWNDVYATRCNCYSWVCPGGIQMLRHYNACYQQRHRPYLFISTCTEHRPLLSLQNQDTPLWVSERLTAKNKVNKDICADT